MNTIELAIQLGHSLQKEESYKTLKAAGEAIDADAELTALIAEFAAKRDSITETTDNEKLESIDKELEALYGRIMSNPKMVAFNEAEHVFGHLMEKIMSIITKAADGVDPDTAEADAHCHDGCCSCGTCEH